jgi:hypothetical protein
MKCEACGSSFVMKNKHSYYCSGYVNGKICINHYGVRRELLQDRLLAEIRCDLLSDTMVNEARVRQRLVGRSADPTAKRRRELEAEVANLTDASDRFRVGFSRSSDGGLRPRSRHTRPAPWRRSRASWSFPRLGRPEDLAIGNSGRRDRLSVDELRPKARSAHGVENVVRVSIACVVIHDARI